MMSDGQQARRAPTIEDLKLKLCWICREEESYGEQQDPPRRWVHPCKCTLVAHESCLLDWIKAAEANPTQNVDNMLKCPQCGTKYKLDSNNPAALKFLDGANVFFSTCGRVVTFLSMGTVVFAFGTAIYILCTGFGAHAFQQFFGEEMYQLILSDDPSNWPISAWIDLPLIPLSLILRQTRLLKNALPAGPIYFLWPSLPASSSLTLMKNKLFYQPTRAISYLDATRAEDILFSWPPSPLMSYVGMNLLSNIYKRVQRRLRRTILGSPSPEDSREGLAERAVRRVLFENVWQVDVRIDEEGLDNVGAQVEQAQPVNDQPAAANPPAPAGGAPVDERNGQDAANGNGNGGREPGTIRMTGAKIGRAIGGALLTPSISNFMGGLLLRLSKHSSWLRLFLAIRPRPSPGLYAYTWDGLEKHNYFQRIGSIMSGAVGLFAAGTHTWRQADPVWWRNTVGLGLYIVAKDCLQLWYEYLSQREIRSRRLLDRPFEGVNLAELDLRDEVKANYI